MFRLLDDREHLYQWDLNQKLVVNDASIKEVHFCNRTEDCALVVEVYELDGARVVNIPNILLQNDWRIKVYAYTGEYTKVEACYKVMPRSKPSDYVYTETELKNYRELEERVEFIEANGVPQEVLNAAIESYLKDNPIESVSSWNDLQDKPFYKNEYEEVIFDSVVHFPTSKSKFYYDESFPFELMAGDTYKVIFGGQEYTCIAGSAISSLGDGNYQGAALYLGNTSKSNMIAIDKIDSGEPFLFEYGVYHRISDRPQLKTKTDLK